MSRMSDLSEAAAAALDDGRDPLHLSFLMEHDVTADECFALAGRMAAGLMLLDAVLATDPEILSGALHGARLAAAYRRLNQALTGIREKGMPT